MKKAAVILAFLVPLASFACKKSEPSPTPPPVTSPPTTLPAPVSIASATLGNAIGADKRVVTPAETFGTKDTIYASVETTGTGHAKLRALWTFVKGEKTSKVDETTIELDATGPTVNEFHISKPSGWPRGDYRVEIFLDDAATPTATKSFKVS
ncbi:MAG TPA: hypothetical protein VKA01_11015 [Vicinamibacteria bacterium]|nr:hypothetical protein [Vicinamibacteria bacterium]